MTFIDGLGSEVADRKLAGKVEDRAELGQRPFVSIIVPVRNERGNIEGCIERLVQQTYPKDRYEVVVLDGMSIDRTRELVMGEGDRVRNACGLSIRLVDNPKGRRASALNIGIKEAKGEVVVRVDARTRLPADYVERCVKTLIETGADNVGGVQRPVVRDSGIDWRTMATQAAIGMALACPFGVGNAQFRLGKKSGYVDTVYLGCFRKSVFDRVGLFDEDAAVITEDSEMNYRIRKAGGKIYLNRDIVAYYYPRETFKDLYGLYFWYGGLRAGFCLKHKTVTSLRQLVAPLFLAANAAMAVIGIFSRTALVVWLGLVGMYVLADVCVSAWLAMRPTIDVRGCGAWSLFWRLLLAFPVMHVAWALGFWRRLFQRPKPGTYWGY